MKTGEGTNDHGTPVSLHKCDTCGTEFTVCPVIRDDQDGWENCMLPECASYDPERDVDVLFASDEEVAKRPVVSMDMLRKRKQGVRLTDGTYAANLDVLKP